jgi:restriction system protein
MAPPDFQEIMRPMLQLADDGRERRLSDAIEQLAQRLNLSDADRNELLPSGQQSRFDNRVGWARTHLGKALLVESPRRGRFRITDRGRAALRQNPSRIDMTFLMQYPEYAEFRSRSRRAVNGTDDLTEEPTASPEESLEASYQRVRATLAQELLERVKQCSPRFFERLVVDLLVAMGYGGSRKDAGQAIGRSGEGGINGIIKEDRLGLDVVYVQAKRWGDTVSRPIVQASAAFRRLQPLLSHQPSQRSALYSVVIANSASER